MSGEQLAILIFAGIGIIVGIILLTAIISAGREMKLRFLRDELRFDLYKIRLHDVYGYDKTELMNELNKKYSEKKYAKLFRNTGED